MRITETATCCRSCLCQSSNAINHLTLWRHLLANICFFLLFLGVCNGAPKVGYKGCPRCQACHAYCRSGIQYVGLEWLQQGTLELCRLGLREGNVQAVWVLQQKLRPYPISLLPLHIRPALIQKKSNRVESNLERCSRDWPVKALAGSSTYVWSLSPFCEKTDCASPEKRAPGRLQSRGPEGSQKATQRNAVTVQVASGVQVELPAWLPCWLLLASCPALPRALCVPSRTFA